MINLKLLTGKVNNTDYLITMRSVAWSRKTSQIHGGTILQFTGLKQYAADTNYTR